MFEAISKGVSNQFQASFQRVSRKFLGVSWKFKDCFKSVMEKRCFKEVLRCFKKVSWVLLENFKGVSRVFHG